MEQVYALGVSCIEIVQEWCLDYEGYFEFINNLSNPHHLIEFVFPVMSIIDSVFASQLLLCLAFGGWLNAVMKWWFLEDRPYWWVRETSFYTETQRPRLYQTRQTCETGPGSPSGHSTSVALFMMLALTWAAHVATDRKWHIPSYVQKAGYGVFAYVLGSVFLARTYVAAHFPHQCILGALFGIFLAPCLCIYVSDPYIWGYGRWAKCAAVSQRWHVTSATVAGLIAVLTYWGLGVAGVYPLFTVKLAFRWCEYPESIHVTTSPVYSLVQSVGYLLGWALAVTPAVAKYRHDTKNRSLIISAFATVVVLYGYNHIEESLCKSATLKFYLSKFALYTIKPFIMLRIMPAISMWPFSAAIKNKRD